MISDPGLSNYTGCSPEGEMPGWSADEKGTLKYRFGYADGSWEEGIKN